MGVVFISRPGWGKGTGVCGRQRVLMFWWAAAYVAPPRVHLACRCCAERVSVCFRLLCDCRFQGGRTCAREGGSPRAPPISTCHFNSQCQRPCLRVREVPTHTAARLLTCSQQSWLAVNRQPGCRPVMTRQSVRPKFGPRQTLQPHLFVFPRCFYFRRLGTCEYLLRFLETTCLPALFLHCATVVMCHMWLNSAKPTH
jgi:hypothetical protein